MSEPRACSQGRPRLRLVWTDAESSACHSTARSNVAERRRRSTSTAKQAYCKCFEARAAPPLKQGWQSEWQDPRRFPQKNFSRPPGSSLYAGIPRSDRRPSGRTSLYDDTIADPSSPHLAPSNYNMTLLAHRKTDPAAADGTKTAAAAAATDADLVVHRAFERYEEPPSGHHCLKDAQACFNRLLGGSSFRTLFARYQRGGSITAGPSTQAARRRCRVDLWKQHSYRATTPSSESMELAKETFYGSCH